MSNWKCCADGEIDFGNESNPEFDPESMAWLTHSSGTTGIPKTIVHPYKNISKLVTFYRWVTEYFNIYFIFRLKFMSKVLVIFFSYRNRFCPQRKFLFMNNMFYPSGIFMCVATAVSHTQSYTLSNYSEESFLAAIDEVKVTLCPMWNLNLVEHEFYSIPNSPIR